MEKLKQCATIREQPKKERTRLVQGKTGNLRRGQRHLVTEIESIVLGQEKFEKLIETQEKMSEEKCQCGCGAEVRNLDDPQMTYRE